VINGICCRKDRLGGLRRWCGVDRLLQDFKFKSKVCAAAGKDLQAGNGEKGEATALSGNSKKTAIKQSQIKYN
jgi:hypothetical protein